LSVKRSQSASRVLLALEKIAEHQPVGVSALAKLLDDDKSAVQRAIMTLADDGWIRPASGTPTRWELTAHIHAVAQMGRGSDDLRQRVRGALEALRNQTEETILLTVPDVRRFVTIEVVESRQLLRTAPPIGMIVPVRESATGRAILPYMSAERQVEMLGGPPDSALLRHFAATRANGYSISDGDVAAGSTNVAAPIIESDGRPIAAVVISAPTDRIARTHHREFGEMVAKTARELSRGVPA
jgi:DNA-binding IclR family transcriptional regulator